MKILMHITWIALLLGGCNEVNTLVNLSNPKDANDQLVLDTTYTVANVPSLQPKNVLIEDFTAVHCDNCPTAQKRTLTLSDANPGRIAVLGIHCTSLDVPGTPGFLDFRTDHGDDLINYIATFGAYKGLPVADFDRKIYQGSPSMLYDLTTSWTSLVNGELTAPHIANLDVVSKSFDPLSRTLSMNVAATFTQASADTFFISAGLIENGIKGYQLTPAAVDTAFIFQHVLRKMINPFKGLQVASAPAKGTTCQVKFSTVLPQSWVADSCQVVVFVHNRSAVKNDVDQVMETTVK